jgi:hypothetical protein
VEAHLLTREARVDETGLLTMTTSQGGCITPDAGGFATAVGGLSSHDVVVG